MKRRLKTLMTSFLAGSMLVASAQAVSFPDVDVGADYAEAVNYVSEQGIIVGDNAGYFNPDQTVTRAQMAAIICRMLGETENLETKSDFPDVPTTHWANMYISKAVEFGIITGYSNGTFGPSNNVTYEQGIAMIVRAVGGEIEAAEMGGYPSGFLAVAETYGLIEGVTAKRGAPLLRADIATIIYNCMA